MLEGTSIKRQPADLVAPLSPLARKIRLTNQLAYLGAGIFWIGAPMHFLSGLSQMGTAHLLIGLVYLLVPFLNQRGLFSSSRLISLALSNAAVLFFSLSFSQDSNVQATFFCLVGIPMLIFLPRERWQTLVATILPIALRLCVEPLRKLYPSSLHTPALLPVYSVLSTFVVIALGVYYLRRSSERAEQAQREMIEDLVSGEERLRLALEAGKMSAWHCDLATGRVSWSQGVSGIAAIDHAGESAIGQLLALVHPADRIILRRELFGCVRDGKPREVEFRVVTPEGGARWLHCRAAAGGLEKQLFGVLQDFTERKRNEAQLAEQQAKLIAASKLSSLGEMAAGIAHEINNPLAIIHGRASLLKELLCREDQRPPRELANFAEKIETTAIRISKIVRSLRSFARDAAQDPYELATVKSIVDDTLEFCAERLRDHQIELRIDLSDPIELECRPVQVSQVLLNLLNNAHDAVEGTPERWILISARDRGHYAELSVTDSGPGIPLPLREKIMQPFFTTKEVGKGTGLGLSVSRGIIEAHQGNLRLDPTSPRTRFVMTIPKVARKTSRAA